MKTLTINQMEETIGGGGNWGDWVCGGATVAGAGLMLLKVAIGPIGTAVTVGCAVYGIGRLADWW